MNHGKGHIFYHQIGHIGSSWPTATLAGQTDGFEAAVHAVRTSFQHKETEAVLMVGASNTFNSLNRRIALHNIGALPNLGHHIHQFILN